AKATPIPPHILSASIAAIVLSSFPSLSVFPSLCRSRKQSTIYDGTSQRHFIRIFQLIPDRDTTRYHTQLHVHAVQLARDIEIRRVPLHRRAQGKDHFLHLTAFHPFHQTFYLQIGRAYAIHGRDDSP